MLITFARERNVGCGQFPLEIAAGDFVPSAGHRLTASSRSAGTLKSTTSEDFLVKTTTEDRILSAQGRRG
jgi:hypothetical protein